MKRYFLLISVMAVAAIAACTKQSIDDIQPYEPSATSSYVYTVKASAAFTKSDYSSTGVFSWSAGDAISVLFHNGTDNKFFTLTTSGTGSSATFSGVIDAGYEIGASDGTVSDKKIWALFPASDNHSYTEGSNPTFYVQPDVDFSATYFSANIPMYALNEAEGSFTFTNLASTYKFTVKNIKTGVDKVQFRIHNQTTYGLSGAWPISLDGSTYFTNYGWASPGSANSTLTYVSDVTSNEAVFYVSCRYWGSFQPVITITNYATGVAIKTFTATKTITPSSFTNVQRIALDVDETNGGVYYTPAVVIDGDFTDWAGVTEWDGTRNNGESNSRINGWRMQADDYNIYVYLDLNSEKISNSKYIYVGFDTDCDTATGSAHGNCPGCEQYVTIFPAVAGSNPLAMIQGTDPQSKVNGSSDGTLTTWCNLDSPNSLLELCIPRSKVGLDDPATIKVSASYDEYDAAQQTLVLP